MKRFLLAGGLSIPFLALALMAQAADLRNAPRVDGAAPRVEVDDAPPADLEGALRPTLVPGPYFPGEQAVTYIRRCITKSLSFQNIDWKEHLSASRDCYSPQGWRSFGHALKESGLVDKTVYDLGRVEMQLDGDSVFAKDENGVPTMWLDTPVVFTQWVGDFSGTDERHVTSVQHFLVRVELTPSGVEGRDSVLINRLIVRGQ